MASGHSVGTIFAEVDLDFTPYTRAQKRLLKDATSTTLNIEKSYKDLGIKSAKEFDLMRAKVHNAYNRITKDAKTSAQDIVRAEKAKADQLKRINEDQFGRQTSLMEKLRANWIALGGAIYTFQRVMRSAITAASDLQETQNKFNVVFRDQIAQAEKWSAALVEGYAMSTRESKQYMASIQDLLKPMGMQSDAAARMSFEVTKLAADIGSFNNQPTAQVMNDIQSALVGNYETMKKYGVVLNATVTQEKALAMGLAATKDELTAGHKAQAAYALIVEGSRDAVGDLARSQGTYATTMKQYKANLEDLMAAIGQHFLPVLSRFVSLLADAARYWGYVFGTSETSVLEKQRDVILGQIKTMEEYKKAGPLMIEFIYGSEEQWSAKKRALELELQDIGRKLNAPRSAPGAPAAAGGAMLLPAGTGDGGAAAVARAQKDIKYTATVWGRPREEETRHLDMYRNYTSYLDKKEKADKEAAADRMKLYKKMGDDEEKIWNAQVKEYKQHTQEMSRTVQDFASNANWTLSEVFFDGMSRDLKSFGDYWGAFWERMKNSLSRTFADMATDWAMGGLKNVLFGGGGGSGLLGGVASAVGSWIGGGASGIASTIGSVIGKLFHEGGIVGDIAGMKAFHDLRSDEVVGILQKGEMVLTRDQAAMFSRMMGGGIGEPGVVGPAGAQMSMGQMLSTIGNIAIGMATGGLSTVGKGIVNVISQELFGQGFMGALTSSLTFGEQMGITQAGGYAQAWGGDIGMSGLDSIGDVGGPGADPGVVGFAAGGLSRGPESGYTAKLHGTEMVVSQKRDVPVKMANQGGTIVIRSPLISIGGNLIADKKTFNEFVFRIDEGLNKIAKRTYA